MRFINLLLITLFSIFLSTFADAQFLDPDHKSKLDNYKDCVAILYKGKMLVDDYSPKGKCKLEQGMTGALTLATVELSDDGAKPIKNIAFKIAIRNSRTNTIWMYSDETTKEVQLEDVLKKCEQNDRIIIMTVDQQYALPHPEIELLGGC